MSKSPTTSRETALCAFMTIVTAVLAGILFDLQRKGQGLAMAGSVGLFVIFLGCLAEDVINAMNGSCNDR